MFSKFFLLPVAPYYEVGICVVLVIVTLLRYYNTTSLLRIYSDDFGKCQKRLSV